MTNEEFIKILDKKGYSYEIEGDKIIVTGRNVSLNFPTSLPPGVVFKNVGTVELRSLTSLSTGVEFKNGGDVDLDSLTSLPPDVVFRNRGDVRLESLTSISPDVVFRNKGDVDLKSLAGGWFKDWSGNIDGIDSKRLLSLMINKGVFI